MLRRAFVGSGTTRRLEGPPSSFWVNGPRLGKLNRASNDPIYLLDSDPIELCDLRRRHPVPRQGADATNFERGGKGGGKGTSRGFNEAPALHRGGAGGIIFEKFRSFNEAPALHRGGAEPRS